MEPTNSPFGSGVLFADKKDGGKRLCIDYRKLNEITVKDRYPLPLIDECLDKMQGACLFTKLDLRSGYHQIRVCPEHRSRTAFNTLFGSYQWLVMPFGLTNAPATFQRLMNSLLLHLPFVVVYFDDILIFSKTEQEHLTYLREVLGIYVMLSFFVKNQNVLLVVLKPLFVDM
jgi:hypothetical protein